MTHQLLYEPAARIAEQIRQRHISAEDLIDLTLNRIAAVNPQINAVVEITEQSARAEAKAVDAALARGEQIGPFAGVPMTVKDSIEAAGTLCTAGTLGRATVRSTGDATLVKRLRQAGAILVGKTNLPDLLFAFESDNLLYGRTNNPYSLARTSGGSSGGEAAILAAGGSAIGLGSDAAGSVRLPSHFCGTAAIKPTLGRLPRTGHVPPAGGWIERIWQIGPMARTVADLQAMMPVLTGGDGVDPTVFPFPYPSGVSTALTGMRVAFFADNGLAAPGPTTVQTIQAAANSLAQGGAHVQEDCPTAIDQCYDLEMRWIGVDGGAGLRRLLGDYGSDRSHPLLQGWLSKVEGFRTDIAGFGKLWGRLDKYRAEMHRFLTNYDVLICPVYPTGALPHGASLLDENFIGFSYTMAFNMTGWPAAVVRCGTDPDGLPLGVQIAGHPWQEDVVLAVAKHLEDALGGYTPPPGAM